MTAKLQQMQNRLLANHTNYLSKHTQLLVKTHFDKHYTLKSYCTPMILWKCSNYYLLQ